MRTRRIERSVGLCAILGLLLASSPLALASDDLDINLREAPGDHCFQVDQERSLNQLDFFVRALHDSETDAGQETARYNIPSDASPEPLDPVVHGEVCRYLNQKFQEDLIRRQIDVITDETRERLDPEAASVDFGYYRLDDLHIVSTHSLPLKTADEEDKIIRFSSGPGSRFYIYNQNMELAGSFFENGQWRQLNSEWLEEREQKAGEF